MLDTLEYMGQSFGYFGGPGRGWELGNLVEASGKRAGQPWTQG